MDVSGDSEERSPPSGPVSSPSGGVAVGSGRSSPGVPTPPTREYNRSLIVNSQLQNRYSVASAPSYIAFVEVESQENDPSQFNLLNLI